MNYKPLALIALAGALPTTETAAQRSMAAVPASDTNGWFSSDDYPSGAALGNRQGRVGARLAIDAGGAIIGCTIEESSGTTLLDEKTCTIAKERGRFNPATDRKGRSITGSYLLHIRWTLPDGPDPIDIASHPRRQSYAIEAYYNADGIMASCRVIEHEPADAKMDTCPSGWVGVQGAKVTRDGKSVAYRIVQHFSREVFVTE